MSECSYCGDTANCCLEGECGRANALRARLAEAERLLEAARYWLDPDCGTLTAKGAQKVRDLNGKIDPFLWGATGNGDARHE
jgi:hypothetical protein